MFEITRREIDWGGRKLTLETGRIATPAFFTVTALARVLGLSLDDLAGDPTDDPAEHEAAS